MMLKEITFFIGKMLFWLMDWRGWLVPDTKDKSKIRKQLRDEDTKPTTVIKELK